MSSADDYQAKIAEIEAIANAVMISGEGLLN